MSDNSCLSVFCSAFGSIIDMWTDPVQFQMKTAVRRGVAEALDAHESRRHLRTRRPRKVVMEVGNVDGETDDDERDHDQNGADNERVIC